jgi:hypothetical protein
MFIIHPTFSWMSMAVVLGFYWLLLRRRIEAPFADVRSGLFVSVAEWAAAKVSELPGRQERAWKPNLLVPVESARELRGSYGIISNIAHPKGTVKVVGLCEADEDEEVLAGRLEEVVHAFRERGVFATGTVIDAGGFADGLIAGMQALRGAFFRPNVLFLRLPDGPAREEEVRRVIREAERERIGTLLYAPHPITGLAQRSVLNVWIRDRSPDWRISWDIGNLDLSLLVALKLRRNWDAHLRLLMVVDDPADREPAEGFLEDLVSLARLPDPEAIVRAGDFADFVARAPQADLSIFGLVADPDFGLLRRLVEETRSSGLFVRDSGAESILA